MREKQILDDGIVKKILLKLKVQDINQQIKCAHHLQGYFSVMWLRFDLKR